MKILIAFGIFITAAAVVIFLMTRRTAGVGSKTIYVNGMKVTIGPAQSMSGPEFLDMLEAQGDEPDPNESFLYIQIPDPVMPVERYRKYEQPIQDALSENSLGLVTGGGTQAKADKTIDYVVLDVTVYDLAKSLPILAAKLRELGAPKGTVILYGDEELNQYEVWERK